MSLGENIVKLRTEKGWTQDDLAERVFTSRQSVSKWENNTSTPELEKLLRLSELFEVSLDELVKGTKVQKTEPTESVAKKQETADLVKTELKESRASTQWLIGLILLCAGIFVTIIVTMLGGLLGGLLFGVPLFGCAVICLAVQSRALLWCGWFIYGIIHFSSLYMTGITWQAIFSSWFLVKVDGNPIRLVLAWVYFIFLLGMIAATVISYRKMVFHNTKKNKKILLTGWTILAGLVIIPYIIARTEWYRNIFQSILNDGFMDRNYRYIMLSVFTQTLDAIKLVLLVLLIIYTRAFGRESTNTN